MKYQLLAFAFWFAVLGPAAILFGVIGAPPWALMLVVFAVVAAQQVYCRLLVPRGTRSRLLKAVDPMAGPPPGAGPANSPLIDWHDELSSAKDWDALRTLLSDDFALVVGKRRFGEKIYIRLLKSAAGQLRGESTIEAVVVHPDEPEVVWVRSTSSGKPRFGPEFVATEWRRIRLTADGSRIREIADAGVLHAA